MKKKAIAVLCITVLLIGLLAGCGSKFESNLPGSWDDGFHTLTFYSDGTYEETMHYGTGTWSILDGNVLKLVDFYGQTKTYQLKDISSDTLTLESGSTWKKIK